MREFDDGRVIQLQHFHLACDRELKEFSANSEPGIVNKQVYSEILIMQLADDARGSGWRGEVKY